MPPVFTRCLLMVALGLLGFDMALPAEDLDVVRHWIVQQGGQLETFDRFARETLVRISGAPQLGEEDPVRSVLCMMAEPERWQRVPLVLVPPDMRQKLGLADGQTHVSIQNLMQDTWFAEVIASRRRDAHRRKLPVDTEQAITELSDRYATLSALFRQDVRVVPPPSTTQETWLPVLEPEGYAIAQQVGVKRSWSSLMVALRQRRPQQIERCAQHLTIVLQNLNPDAYLQLASTAAVNRMSR